LLSQRLCAPAAFELLRDVVDVYVADFKFGNDACARRLAKVDRYVGTVTRNLKIAAAQGDLIVRHLLLPGHFECCYRSIVAHLASELPNVKFSIRTGYLPRWQASRYEELARTIERDEAANAFELAHEYGLNVID